jgi:hypothetical protein
MGPESSDHETYDLGWVEVGHPVGTAPRPKPARRPPDRRRLAAVAAALLVAVGVGLVVRHGDSPTPSSKPTSSHLARPAPVLPPSVAPPLPAVYRNGALLVAMVVDLSQPGSSAFTVRTTRPGPYFAVRCPERMSGSGQYEVRVNGHLVLGSSCSAPDPDGTLGRVDGAIDASAGPGSWSALGVRQGHPVTVVVSVTLPSFATTPAPLMSVGLYQAR